MLLQEQYAISSLAFCLFCCSTNWKLAIWWDRQQFRCFDLQSLTHFLSSLRSSKTVVLHNKWWDNRSGRYYNWINADLYKEIWSSTTKQLYTYRLYRRTKSAQDFNFIDTGAGAGEGAWSLLFAMAVLNRWASAEPIILLLTLISSNAPPGSAGTSWIQILRKEAALVDWNWSGNLDREMGKNWMFDRLSQ